MRIALALLLLLLPSPLLAAEIHKCRDAEGRIAYQDQPCPAQSLPLPPIAAPPSEPYLPEPAPSDPTAGDSPATASPASPPPPALPALYRCTREDGESYVSSDPSPAPRYVPAWVVGATSTDSNLRRTPAREAYDRAVGGAWMLVQDRCRPMGRTALCEHWKSRLDGSRRQAKASFFEEREALEQEGGALRELLRVHCGR